MGKSVGEIRLENITQEQIEQFYDFLQGEVPKQLHMKRHPRLSSQMAFKIIYYLQEIMEIIPDKFERCKTCGRIFNSEAEGNPETLHCDYCRKD